MQAGYLRAALMELVGMEEALPRDLRRLGVRKRPLRLWDTGNAMLILLRELRHVQVHVALTKFEREHRPAVVRGLGKEVETVLTALIIPRVDLEQLRGRRQARHFDAGELRAAIDWLDSAQRRWGIFDVVLAAFNHYATLIVGTFAVSAV